mgnify:FL=1
MSLSLTILLFNRFFLLLMYELLEAINMIKALIATITTAFLAVGCVAFPEDGYSSRGGYYGNTSYGTYDDRGYKRNNRHYDDRYDRERAYRLQQARIEQDRRQRQLDHERRQFDQTKRDQYRLDQAKWQQRQQEWQKKQQNHNHNNGQMNRPNHKTENNTSNLNQSNKKRDNRRGAFNHSNNQDR